MNATIVARHAAALWTAALATAVMVALLLAFAGVDELARGRVYAYLEHRQHGVGRIAEILGRNLAVAGVFLSCAFLVGNSRRWRRELDVFVIGTGAVFVIRFAVMLGAFGWPLARYMATYGPLEAGGFAVAAGAYLSARRQSAVTLRDLASAAMASGALLTIAAVAEARWAGIL